MTRYIFFDTETTGLPRDRRLPAISGNGNWPEIVSLSWILYEDTRFVRAQSYIVQPNGWRIGPDSSAIHGIDHDFACRHGLDLDYVLEQFRNEAFECDVVVAHNLAFDLNVIDAAWYWHICPERGLHSKPPFGWPKTQICTAEYGKDICKFPFPRGGEGFRFPKLAELYTKVVGRSPPRALHCSLNDTLFLAELFFHLRPAHRPHLKGEALFLDIQNGLYPPRAPTPQVTLRLDLSGGDV